MSRVPIPFRQFVLKVHSRCDLACDHCYVYEHSDQSWRGRPRELGIETAAQFAERVAEHAAAHWLSEVRVILHGGEPLLLGPDRMRETLEELCAAISPVARLDLRIHTNAVLLTEPFLELFAEYDVKIGVSLDGDRTANDRHRVYRDRRSSYDQVVAALERLRRPEYRHLYAGLLCTIDIANDPIAVYHGLAEQQPPRVDLLLPHATWGHQPPGLAVMRDPRRPTEGDPVYARWLGAIFDAWNIDGRPMQIRTFDSVIAALHGRPVTTEALGLDPVDLLVIESDGTIEQVDSLKTAFAGAAATGLDIWRNTLDEAAAVPGIAIRQHGIDGVSAVCRGCELVHVCGGGLYSHRYRPGHGFDNPSVYCADLKEMITHMTDHEERGVRALSLTYQEREPGHDDDHSRLTLSAAEFGELAAGCGSPAAIRTLAGNQAVVQRSLLAVIARSGPQQDRRFTTAWDLLATLSEFAPDSVTAVLAHPYTRVWAVKLVTELSRGTADPEDVYHLEALAASAAIRAEYGEPVPVPVRGGLAPLPGLGSLLAGAGDRTSCPTMPDWQLQLAQPLRHVDAAGLRITIEDTDPYRGCHGHPEDRLGDARFEAWSRALPEAITFIDEHLPHYAPGLREGLTTIMPMRNPEDGTQRSAVARDAFGSIGVALPNDSATLARLLVHEFQHIKLGALLDIAELYDLADTEHRHYAPWRPDPRPLEGLLQGTYAHIAVVDFWRVRRTQLSGPAREAADFEFARWRMHTEEAIHQLSESTSLTPLGRVFVGTMSQTADSWRAEHVDPSILRAARTRADQHRADFAQRNPLK